jgi:hypothetical protein
MFAAMHLQQFNSDAKQAGFMPTYWLSINRENNSLGFQEGSGYA